MFLLDQYALPYSLNLPRNMSCYLNLGQFAAGIDSGSGCVVICSTASPQYLPVLRKYFKITYHAGNRIYYGICAGSQKYSSGLYVLNENFEETDCIPIFWECNASSVCDVFYSQYENLLYLTFPHKIYKNTMNGDSLGAFLTSPYHRSYQCVCTFGRFLFVAYEEGNCSYVASYTLQGSFLEKISIGNDFKICNMQIIQKNKNATLVIFAYKNNQYPYLIEIALEENQAKDSECTECGIEIGRSMDPYDMEVTCHVDCE